MGNVKNISSKKKEKKCPKIIKDVICSNIEKKESYERSFETLWSDKHGRQVLLTLFANVVTNKSKRG